MVKIRLPPTHMNLNRASLDLHIGTGSVNGLTAVVGSDNAMRLGHQRECDGSRRAFLDVDAVESSEANIRHWYSGTRLLDVDLNHFVRIHLTSIRDGDRNFNGIARSVRFFVDLEIRIGKGCV
eukprot:SAG31_NODE_3543_length_4142_cov_11.404622_7_plen_123_part_00